MSEDLRQKVVEAMAARIWNELPRYGLMYPECERIANVALDQALDILADNAEAWAVDPFEVFVAGDGYNSIRPRVGVDVVNQVIDSLRSPTSSKGDGEE